MKKTLSIIGLTVFGMLFSQDIAFNKLYGNSDPVNYYLTHYPVAGSDGLDIKWYGGIRLQTTGSILQLLNNGNVGIGTIEPQTRFEVAKENSNNKNVVMARFSAYGATGGSNMISIGYHNTANLELNSGYTSSGFRYGDYGDFNIENDNEFNASFGAINFITNKKIQLAIKPNGNALLNGKFEAKEIKVTSSPTADFVFDENYDLPRLEDIEKHIKEKKHLPEIASAKMMEKEGVNVGEFQIKLLQKIEELTLYSIEQNKQIKQLQEENKTLKSESEEINKKLHHILSITK
ncbi:hypothetical protein M9991_01565 [Chryseobacterium gallinarum]|uniref:hypothetical protein n=1 Tax=Chryseobacterium gallinarum TaxID=1324352 RepID=UPI0020241476|nr:hypothetical protein [Chryseobacterium gallinarum]MCL8535551.1 hypothetical protein [Chryseobacterium gallinarum]